jgi:hypothetical protein
MVVQPVNSPSEELAGCFVCLVGLVVRRSKQNIQGDSAPRETRHSHDSREEDEWTTTTRGACMHGLPCACGLASRPSTYHRHIPCMHQRRKRSVPRKSKPQIDLSIARRAHWQVKVSCMQFPCLRVTRSLPSLVIIIYKLSSLHGHHGSVVSSNRVTCQAKLSTTFCSTRSRGGGCMACL